MKEAAAWRVMAEWLEDGQKRRREFLCHLLGPHQFTTYELDPLPESIPKEQMFYRLQNHYNERDMSGGSTLDVLEFPENNITRSMFCLFMALECQDER